MSTQSTASIVGLSKTATDSPSETVSATKSPSIEAIRRVEQKWRDRAKTMQYGKKASVTYRKAEIEYYVGAMVAFDYAVPAWTICILSGRNPTPDVA